MSVILERLLAQALDEYPKTVTLSPESVTVLLFASGFLERRINWLDEGEEPLDEVTDEDWDVIEAMTSNLYFEVYHPMIGFVFPLITATLPDNCLLCDGTEYAKNDYPALYNSIDAAFIVDADTFRVPDLRSRFPIGAGEGTGLSSYAVNDTGGEETHVLSVSELASHQHGLFQSTSLAVAPGELPVVIPFIAAAGSTDLTGLGAGHENRPPFVALSWAVVAF